MAIPQRLCPPVHELRQFYVGKDLTDVPKPAVVIDRARMRRHCESILRAAEALGVGFRAHVKTHKTVEGTELQVGSSTGDVNLVASTIAEFEHLLPLLRKYQADNRRVNMLYGIPLLKGQVTRLAAVGRDLGAGTISVMIDHASQLDHLTQFFEEAGFPAEVVLKVDTGYHRAGLPPTGMNKDDLIASLMKLENEGKAKFSGLYSHSSLSYNDTTPSQAMINLQDEITGCLDALQSNAHLFTKNKQITISVGASPQVTSIENLLRSDDTLQKVAASLQTTVQSVSSESPHGFQTNLELHAGVYSVLDVQQLSTHSRTDLGDYEDEIAISVVAEVCSVYNNNEREFPEALVGVGVLGLGREPCVAYKGWGVIDRRSYGFGASPERRLIASRVSQEHSIVTWDEELTGGSEGEAPPIPLTVGETCRIFPNHACITGALYGWYLIVDSDDSSRGREVVDVWVRASGW